MNIETVRTKYCADDSKEFHFFNHRADRMEEFCENIILCNEICSPAFNLCLKSQFSKKIIEYLNRR